MTRKEQATILNLVAKACCEANEIDLAYNKRETIKTASLRRAFNLLESAFGQMNGFHPNCGAVEIDEAIAERLNRPVSESNDHEIVADQIATMKAFGYYD